MSRRSFAGLVGRARRLDRDHPGFNGAVVERVFLNARSMHNFMNSPSGAIYGFAPIPFEHSILSGVPRSPKTPIPGVYRVAAAHAAHVSDLGTRRPP
jgi:all-trans-retinol 13,14-reductase